MELGHTAGDCIFEGYLLSQHWQERDSDFNITVLLWHQEQGCLHGALHRRNQHVSDSEVFDQGPLLAHLCGTFFRQPRVLVCLVEDNRSVVLELFTDLFVARSRSIFADFAQLILSCILLPAAHCFIEVGGPMADQEYFGAD